MLPIVPIALLQLKVAIASENLLSKIVQLIYSLQKAKEITENVRNNIMNSIKL